VSEYRPDVFVRALEAISGIGEADLGSLFTDDVTGWSPVFGVSSRAELAEVLDNLDDSFSNATIKVTGIDAVGNKVIAEWRFDADHTGPLLIGDELVTEATGRHVHMAGATFADFRGDRIKAFRTYFDDVALVEQLLVAD
jgi:limonene-1,2-epoxide hydrolase